MTLYEWCLENNKEYLLSEWNYNKNGDTTPDNISHGSNRKVWWVSSCGYEWQAVIYNRAHRGDRCPVEAGKVVTEQNSLLSKFPEIAKEWHTTKNGTLTPKDVLPGSNRKVWWVSSCGYEWQAVIAKRALRGDGCPVDAGKVVTEQNSLLSKFPEIANEWHPTKNGTLTAKDVLPGSNRKVWWVSSCGYEWQAVIANRTLRGDGCPVDAGKVVIEQNSFLSKFPEIANEWHPTKNGALAAKDVLPGSNKKVWWKCNSCGHEWQAVIDKRTHRGDKCPNHYSKTSFPEQMIYYYFKKTLKCEVINRAKVVGKEVDVYVPSFKFGIDYRGHYSHNYPERQLKDEEKTKALINNGNTIIVVKPSDVNFIDLNTKTIYCIIDEGYKFMNFVLDNISKFLSNNIGYDIKFNINLDRDRMEILNQYHLSIKEGSLALCNPKLANEWNINKNGNMTPDRISYGSGKKVWWVCSFCGHEWQATVNNRNKGKGCPNGCHHKKNQKTTDVFFSL